eukprot:1010217-Amphidinium_carterae.1
MVFEDRDNFEDTFYAIRYSRDARACFLALVVQAYRDNKRSSSASWTILSSRPALPLKALARALAIAARLLALAEPCPACEQS